AKIHLTLADEYTSLNFDSCRHYATLAIELALKGDMPKTVIKATIILSQISTYRGDFITVFGMSPLSASSTANVA
ncbi:MAG: hypothetical protein AAGA64_15100, partial [Bacteroidota bacterium]